MSAEGNTGGYALLRGRFWSFTLCKLFCIIGRAPTHYHQPNANLPVIWHVDLDLGHLKKVSRQHALIIYNFEDAFWEIKCISRKYPVFVGKK